MYVRNYEEKYFGEIYYSLIWLFWRDILFFSITMLNSYIILFFQKIISVTYPIGLIRFINIHVD
jgi:hypothetical protein